MQALVSKLMVGLVLAQAVSGWCCHRPCHCLDGEAAEISLAGIDDCGHDECCHEDAHAASAFHASSHCQCHECLGFCTYLSGAKLQIARPHTIVGPDAIATTIGTSQTQLAATHSSQLSSAIIHLGPPVRLHLLHQSLLI
jgi:hypothetical protein